MRAETNMQTITEGDMLVRCCFLIEQEFLRFRKHSRIMVCRPQAQ